MQVLIGTFTITAVVFGAFVALGTAVDHLLIRHQKTALHKKLTAWWVKIDETRVVDLGKLMASSTLHFVGRIFKWRIFSWQTLVLSLLLSFCATSLAFILGLYLDRSPMWHSLPALGIYLMNYPFDFLTMIVTIKVLHQITHRGFKGSLFLVLIDIFVAFLLASSCIVTLVWGDRVTDKYMPPYFDILRAENFFNKDQNLINAIEIREKTLKRSLILQNEDEIREYGFDLDQIDLKILEKIPDYRGLFINGPLLLRNQIINSKEEGLVNDTKKGLVNDKYKVLVVDDNHKKIIFLQDSFDHMTWWPFFVSCTTLFPTAVYMTVLMLILLSKIILHALRTISMHLLERITQDDPDYDPDKFKPGTLFGYLFGSVAALSNAVVVIIKTLSS